MAKDKMNIPQIRFKGFEGEWNNRIIDGVIQLRSEVGNQEDFTVDIELENLVSNLGVIVGDTTVRTQANSLFRSGDILFGRLRPYLNKWWLSNTDGVKSGEIWALYPKSEGSNRFIYSLIQTEKFLTYVNLTSGTKMPRADWSVIKNHSIDIPKLNEQTQIGDFFQKIDQVIELQQKALDTARAYKQSMLQKMFPQKGEKVPRVRFKGFSGDWKLQQFQEIFDYERPDKYIVKNTDYLAEGIPVLTANKSFLLGYTNEDNVYKKGDCIIFDDFTLDSKFVNFPFMVKSSAIKILTAKKGVHLRFAFEVLNIAKITSEGHARHYISIVQPFRVFMPSLKEQTAIGNFFQKLDQQIKQQAQKLATYQQLKKAMLQRMFV